MFAQSNPKLPRKVGMGYPILGQDTPPLGSSQHAPYGCELLELRISAIHSLMPFILDLRGAGGFSYPLATALTQGIFFKECENPLPRTS